MMLFLTLVSDIWFLVSGMVGHPLSVRLTSVEHPLNVRWKSVDLNRIFRLFPLFFPYCMVAHRVILALFLNLVAVRFCAPLNVRLTFVQRPLNVRSIFVERMLFRLLLPAQI